MSFLVYNSLTRKKEEFKPKKAPLVTMYVCGPTVYDYLHVGNFRGPVVFNLLRNWLEEIGYHVTYALNFTDVDDKIINRAKDEKVSSSEISEKYIQEYIQDFQSLGLRPHELNPKVTDHMDDIIEMVDQLVKRKKAYIVDHDVLYSIADFPTYGKLSGRKTDELIAGSRVEVDEKKKNPLDFALWKSAKTGEVSWPSKWGHGRPGWHIECSAMIHSLFGEQIDIHGGGMDLIFPHHENEIAQSEGCLDDSTGHQMVLYWMHVNMLNLSGQKMSKSLGNMVTLRDFVKIHDPEIYKFVILGVHHRSILDFGEESVHRSVISLAKIYSSLSLMESLLNEEFESVFTTDLQRIKNSGNEIGKSRLNLKDVFPGLDGKILTSLEELKTRFEKALNDDLNMAEFFATVFDFIREINSKFKRGMKLSEVQKAELKSKYLVLKYFGQLMSLFQQRPSEFLKGLDQKIIAEKKIDVAHVEKIINERVQARSEKNFQKSDELRLQLTELGIQVSDLPSGCYWEVIK
ncbi:MAG: cysteine--tRNA ligase [Pseudobdellovibrionaceae bacterium]